MRITITTLSDKIFTLDVNDELELENFKALCEFECGVPANEISLLWNGRPLSDSKTTLKGYGIKEGDMLLLQQIRGSPGQARSPQSTNVSGNQSSPGAGRPMAIDFGSIQMPGTSGAGASGVQTSPNNPDPAHIREMLLANPHELSILKERNPPLAEALLSGSLDKFREVFSRQHKEHVDRERDRLRLLHSNPFDPAVQEKIEEEIRLKNVETNMETAMEYAPESFGQVVMLYIHCRVNGHDVKAFVDSGAQMTIMSQECAQRCSINRLVDTRWAGVAKGVGTQKIIGRVHLGQIQIGSDFLQSSFSILEDQPMDMLLGLDMLKRHQCCIDLKRNLLIIGTTGTETSFLSESELPSHARLNLSQSKHVEDEDRQLAEALSRSAAESGDKNNSNTGAASVASPAYPPEVISRLASYGFSQQEILDQLKLCNGNADQALAALLAGSLTMPKPKN